MKSIYYLVPLFLLWLTPIINAGNNCFFGSFAGGLTGSMIGNAMSQPRREYREVRVVEQRPVVVQHVQQPRYAPPPATDYRPNYHQSPASDNLRQAQLEAVQARKEAAQFKSDLEDTKVRLAQAEATIAECQAELKKLANENAQIKSLSKSE